MSKLLEGKRILVVDDNIDAAWVVGEIIATQGHTVMLANGGRDAIEKVSDFSPDVMFLDLGMPDVDGYEVATTLRRDHRFDALRIVALTAWGDQNTHERVKSCGFDAHLVKPAKIESLYIEANLTRDSVSE